MFINKECAVSVIDKSFKQFPEGAFCFRTE